MEAAEVMKLIGKIKNIDEHNVRRNAKNILQHKKTDEGLKMNMFLKELEERGTFIFKRKVKIIVNIERDIFGLNLGMIILFLGKFVW